MENIKELRDLILEVLGLDLSDDEVEKLALEIEELSAGLDLVDFL